MRSLFRLVLLSLVLLMVALISAVTAMRFAIHGREVAIPRLIGMTPTEAERTAAASGLELQVERRYFSPDVAEGKIMSQVPDPGTKVRRGWQIRVAESLGPQRVTIPDVTGQTQRAAEINIERRGLDLGATATLATANSFPEQVLAQSPPANASGVSAPRISLLIAGPSQLASYVMPNFVGQPLGNVAQIIEKAGMKLGNVTIAEPEQTPMPTLSAQTPSAPAAPATPAAPASLPSPLSLILSQTPAAGQKITLGSVVNFEVSR